MKITQQQRDEERAEDAAEPEHRARLVELAIAVGGPVGPLLLRLRPDVVLVHGENVLPDEKRRPCGAPFLVGGGGSLSVSAASRPRLYPVRGEGVYPRWMTPFVVRLAGGERQVQRLRVVEEEPSSGAAREREHEEVQLVDEPIGEHCAHEHRAAADVEVAVDRSLELLDLIRVVRPEDRRVPPCRPRSASRRRRTSACR